MSQWISVKDQLPSNEGWCNDRVLFATGEIIRIGGYDYEDGFWYEDNGAMYQCQNSIDRGAEIKGGVCTHWQPLPSPPIHG